MFDCHSMPISRQGHKKLGGRQKGSKNKKTLLSVEQLLKEYDINPIEKLIEIAESKEASIEQRIRCWQEVAKYTYPKYKAIEYFSDEDSIDSITVRFVDANYQKIA